MRSRRVALVVLAASAAACTSGNPAPRATPSGTGSVASPAPRPDVTPFVRAAAPATATRDTNERPTERSTVEASTAPSLRPSAGRLPADSRCGTPKYRCVTLDQALTWWDGKLALVPRSGTAGVRAMLHAASDPDVRRSDDADNPPSLTYVLPDSLFPAMTARRGGVSGAARSGGIVVRTYFVTGRWLPALDDRVSRRVTVRGRDAILSEFRTSDTRSLLRDVKWWVPHGDGTYVLWLVEDDGAHRSEKELIDTLNALAEA